MVYVTGVPAQLTPALVYVGVTVIVAVMGDAPALVAVNDGTFPAPLAARPMAVLLFAQLNVVPLTELLNTVIPAEAPLQYTWLATAFTVPAGFTMIVKVLLVPTQLTPPFTNVGVTVIVAVTGAVPVLVAVNDGIFPAPLAANPMDGALLTQL